MLGQYPDFSTFNNYLTQSQLAGEINSRRTITVLAVDNSAMAPLSGQSPDVTKKIMSLHVVLDYYDIQKLQKLPNKTDKLTTLFQASGQAVGQMGFLNVTNLNTGTVAIGSAVPSSALGSNLVKSVVAQPYNISVLQISTVIIPTDIGKSNSNSTSPPTGAPTKSPTPAKSPSTVPPTSAKPPAPSVAKTPSASPPKSGEAPAHAPSDAPSTADTPMGSPPIPDTANGPTAEGSTSDAMAPEGHSSGTRPAGIQLAILMMVVSSAWSFVSMI